MSVMPDPAATLAIIAVCHRLAAQGYVAATDGNVSARLEDGDILVTPAGMNKGVVTEADLVRVRPDGKVISGSRKPSTEIGMHLFLYAQRPDVHAVVHAHPIYATAFAAVRLPLTGAHFPEVVIGVGAVPLAPYATPSTDEVRKSLAPYVKECHAILLASHGVVTMGASLEEALGRMEKVEQTAHVLTVARILGGAKRLTTDELTRLRKVSITSYGKDPGPLSFLETEN